MKKIIAPIVILAVVATLLWFTWPFLEERFFTSPDPNSLFSSGVVECTEINVGSELSGVISELVVNEGDLLKDGDLIARIDTEEMMIRLKGAEANVKRAAALLSDAKKGLRPEEIAQLKKVVEMKEALYQRAKVDFERKQAMAVKDVGTKNAAILAEKAMQAAREDLETARQQVEIASMGARSDQLRAAEMALRQAETQAAELRNRIADSEVLSPIDGIVNVKHKEKGEIAAIGTTLVSLINLDKPWIRIYIPENKLGRVKLGQEVVIRSDSYPDKEYRGEIRHISSEAEFTPKNVQTQEERVKLVYAAKVYMDNSHREFKPGMPVDVYIQLEPQPEEGNGSSN